MQLATWNVNSLSVRLPQVLDWLAAHPDVHVLALQETKLTDDKFPVDAFAEAGWQAAWFGQRTYNGVALISRQPGQDVVRNIPGMDCDMARVLSATYAAPDGEPMRVVGAYFPNGQAPGSDKFAYKMRWLQALQDWLRGELAQHPRLALVGDFNVAPEDRDSYDPEGLRETIHHTTQERQHFQALLGLGLTDAFRQFDQPDKSYSWWDYRMLGYQKNRGLRIDHILVSAPLLPQLSACSIDRVPRKWPKPSDHAPVTVTLS